MSSATPFLEIVHLTGETEQRPLERRQAVSIGSHSSNDIRITEDDVEPLHCRVSWNKNGFEAVAAGVDGLDLNGVVVQRATLKPGDVLRFGSVDIRYREAGDSAVTPEAAAGGVEFGGIDLKPLSEEIDVPVWLKEAAPPAPPPKPVEKNVSRGKPAEPIKPAKPRPAAPAPTTPERKKTASSAPVAKVPSPPRTEPPQRRESPRQQEVASAAQRPAEKKRPAEAPPRPKPKREPEPSEPFDLDAGLAALASESRSGMTYVPSAEIETKPSHDLGDAVPARGRKALVEIDPSPTPPAEAPPEISRQDPVSQRLRSALKHQRVRPGEEDLFRSPLILGLTGTAVVIVLLSAIFYFVGFRRSTLEEFELARQLFGEQKYTQAISEFNKFITRHPDHSLVVEAGRLLGLARTDQLIVGAAPNYSDGMKQLKTFVSEQRESEDFLQIQPEITKRAGEVALGAAKMAGKVFQRELVDVSKEARSMLETYSPKDAQPTELLNEIDLTQRASEAAILKHNTHEEELSAIDAALKNNQPLEALRIRRELVARYPGLEQDKRVATALQQTLEKERSLTKEETLDRDPIREPRPGGAKATTLVYQARTRTDQVSVGRAVPVVAKDSVYGIHTITGGPVWRQVVGIDTPFFPVRDAETGSLIVFDSMNQELLRLDQNTGQVIWRQPIDETVSGRPLLDEGQIFVPTAGGRLYRIDLESGVAIACLTFSQDVSNPVPLSDGKRLVVAGEREVFYTLTKRPFACVGVSYVAQPAQSIVAPLLSMGPYILAAQNKSGDACRLRLLREPNDDQGLQEVATADIAGQVVDAPVIRGRDLFVPGTGERVAAFQISDDSAQPPLSTGPTYQVKGAQQSISHLATAPDGEVFMASTALRKLQLSVESLQPAQEAILLGTTSQPLQYQDRMLFVARQRPFSDGVVFTPIDRSTLAGDWQAVVGAGILALSPVSGDNPSLTCVTTAGQLFRITAKQLETGGFLSVAERLPLNDQLVDPLLATAVGEGQILVAGGLPDPKLWFINRVGQIERSLTLSLPLTAAPVMMGRNILAPIAGRLQLLQGTSAQPAAQEFRLSSDLEETTAWKQVFAVDENNAMAVLDNGVILGVRLQTSPRPNLSESGRFSLDAPLANRPAFDAGRLAVAANNGRVVVLSAEGLEPLGDRQFPAPVARGPWLVGETVFVEVDGSLEATSLDRELPTLWSVALDGTHVAGAPVLQGTNLLIPLRDGRLLLCDPQSGEVLSTQSLGATLSGSPIIVGAKWYIPSTDGSLIDVPEAP